MKMRKTFYTAVAVVLVTMLGLITYTGCQSSINEQGQQVTSLTPAAVETLDKAVEVAPVVRDSLIGVGVAFPALLPMLGALAGVIGGLAGAYKKFRPELTAETAKAKLYADTTTAIVYAIEKFKESNGQDWDELKADLKEELLGKVGPEALAIIEAIVQAYRKHETINNT